MNSSYDDTDARRPGDSHLLSVKLLCYRPSSITKMDSTVLRTRRQTDGSLRYRINDREET